MTYYYNEGQAWNIVNLNVRQNPRVTSNMKETMEQVDGTAYYLTACDTFFLVEKVPDDSLYAGSSLHRVGCVHLGDTVLFDLDRETLLPVRRIENSGSRHVILDDYRDTNGPKIAFHVVTYNNGARTEEFVWDEFRFDVEIDDAVFEEDRPATE